MEKKQIEIIESNEVEVLNEFGPNYTKRFSYQGHSWNRKPYIAYNECLDNILDKGEETIYD